MKAIAGLHSIQDAVDVFGFLDRASYPGETPLARNLAWARAWYEWAVPGLGGSPMVERALAWLEANEPATATDTVLCWGDSRIGNVMYQDFAPVGVLDWEMARIGPREMDLSWMVFAHQVFESITEVFEMPGMPHFMREEDVLATYAAETGRGSATSPGTTSTTASSGAWSSCGPGCGRSTSARSRGRTTSRRSCSTASR